MLSFRWLLIGCMGLCSILERENAIRWEWSSGCGRTGMVFGRREWNDLVMQGGNFSHHLKILKQSSSMLFRVIEFHIGK
jgi:hypothetical protein